MKKQFLTCALALCCLLMLAGIGQAEEGKFFGKVYFNYNHDFSQDRGPGSGQTNGFSFTRIYFGYDRDIAENFSIRFLMDVDNTKDTDGKSAWRPFMKNAYLAMDCKMVEGSKVYFGMIAMPFVGVPENHWGYRSLYQLAMDKQGWGSTADIGVGWKGMWNDMLQVEFALANGAGYKNPEGDMFKLVELRPTVYLMEKAVTLSAFGSYEAQNDSASAVILAILAGYDHQVFRVGAEYSMRSKSDSYVNSSGEVTNLSSNNISAWLHLKPAEKFTVLGRYDLYEPNADADKDKSSVLIVGLDYHPVKNVRFIPNVQITMLEAEDDPITTSIDESASTNTAFLTFEYNW